MSARELGALVLLGALWGASFLFIRVAVPALGPFVLMELRVGLAAGALAAYAGALSRAPALRGRWREFLTIGALNAAIPFTLIAAAEIELPAGLAAILNSTTALFAPLVAAAWIGEPLVARQVVGVVLGVAGVAVLVGWDPIPLNAAILLSAWAVLLASLSYSLGAVYAKRTFAGVPSMTMAIGQQVGAAALLLPLAAATLPEEAPPTVAALSVLGLSLLCTAAAYLLYFYLIAAAGPTKTLTVTFLIPVFGLLFGVLLLGERVGAGTLAGFVIILASLGLVTGAGRGGAKG
jgi:drug/metabolite transporter (DMT)-like permease